MSEVDRSVICQSYDNNAPDARRCLCSGPSVLAVTSMIRPICKSSHITALKVFEIRRGLQVQLVTGNGSNQLVTFSCAGHP
jgi:hypothetical protein